MFVLSSLPLIASCFHQHKSVISALFSADKCSVIDHFCSFGPCQIRVLDCSFALVSKESLSLLLASTNPVSHKYAMGFIIFGSCFVGSHFKSSLFHQHKLVVSMLWESLALSLVICNPYTFHYLQLLYTSIRCSDKHEHIKKVDPSSLVDNRMGRLQCMKKAF